MAVCVIATAAAPPPAAVPASVAPPATPAGRMLSDWLDAFNSGDRTRMAAFLSTHEAHRTIEEDAMLRDFTGGYDLIKIDASQPLQVVFRVREKTGANEAIGKFDLDPAKPSRLRLLGIWEAPHGARYDPVRIDGAARARIVEGVADAVANNYVFADKEPALAAGLREHLRNGDYDAIVEGEDLSERLTRDLIAASGDKHFAVDFYLLAQPAPAERTRAQSDAHYAEQMARENCGFAKVEHLPGNIGYLHLDQFAEPRFCGERVAAAMTLLADSDALVVDLRDNGGGAPRMVALLSSYLFDHSVHLEDFASHAEATPHQIWTQPWVPGHRFIDKPVTVLVSKNTFSAAEEFAYNLQVLKRGTVVGEVTAGGANPVEPHRLDAHFTVLVPFSRAINPVTGTNWDGKGVQPDVATSADGALEAALAAIRKEQGGKPH